MPNNTIRALFLKYLLNEKLLFLRYLEKNTLKYSLHPVVIFLFEKKLNYMIKSLFFQNLCYNVKLFLKLFDVD